MTPDAVGPFSRPVSVDRLPAVGQEIRISASAEECAALARDFNLEAVHRLEGRYRLAGSRTRIRVTGRVTATITQVCVVTLDPFDSVVDEEVEVDFAPSLEAASLADGDAEDPPDPIADGILDLGALTAEFLALGLDPHPRKPGVEFAPGEEADAEASPFAALRKLKRD